ncbi:hypothetical protein KI387_042860 [Taxus chinensis]|uniref:ATP-dependent DNA helicase PIF1 n=1 Tax=Taxus chinensis TaxID=29808 RepID=A0AA38F7Q6_TAXCH|nr:hypothetical protein KI387_042860 [Taxus chinensis]
MLIANLWVDAGLVNGATGTITDIVYDASMPPPTLPLFVVVKFDRYNGPCWDPSNPLHIPIPPISRGNRRQLPIKMAWGLTIHKSQGLTLHRATIDIGTTERQGLTFTTFSRVPSLANLRISPPFSFESSPWTEKCNLSISSSIQPNPNESISSASNLLHKGQMLPQQVSPNVDTVRKLEVDDGKAPQQRGNVNGIKTHFPTLLRTASKFKIPPSGMKNSAKVGMNLQAEYGSGIDSSVQKQNKFFTVRFKVVEVPLFFRLTRDNSRGSGRDESSTDFQKKSEDPDGNIAECKSNERNKKKVKEILLKYVKMIKPLYVKISQRHNEKTRHAYLEKAGVCIGARNNGFLGSERSIQKQLSFSGNLRTAHKHFFKERDSSVYVNPDLPGYSLSTMMEFQSAIQGAIAHCKRSNYTDGI